MRHSDLTTNQVREKLFVWFCTSIMITWSILFLVSHLSPVVSAVDIEIEGNLTNNKPTDRWRLNSNWFSQKYTELEWNTRDDRSISLLEAYWFDGVHTWSTIKTIARIHRIHPEMFICIMYADSSIGRFLKTSHNYGNVWNNDRWDRVDFATMEQGINAIWRYALNGSYLKSKYTVDYLSPALWKPWPYYATSEENWHVNIMNCLWMIHNKKIEDNWNFRR